MTDLDAEALLAMLRDPNRETQEISTAARSSREDAARASRVVLGIAKVKPEEILTLPRPLALAVLCAAAAARRGDLLAAAAAHPAKEVAKEAKRVLYGLKSRGVTVPTPQPRAPPPPAPAAPAPVVPCFASAVDGRGERAIWVGRLVPGKGIEVGQAIASDRVGLTEVQLAILGRKEYRGFCKDLLEQGAVMAIAELDRAHAVSLLCAARARNDAAGTRPPEGADAWLSRLGPAEPATDPAAGFPPLDPELERAAVEASGKLHELPLFRGWIAEEDALRSLEQKLEEIAASELYLDERQRLEAAEGALLDAVARYFDRPCRALWASRLFSVAEHLERMGDPNRARQAAATARALAGYADPASIPFARALLEKAFPPAPVSSPKVRVETPEPLLVSPAR
jgi:hypothetical protein